MKTLEITTGLEFKNWHKHEATMTVKVEKLETEIKLTYDDEQVFINKGDLEVAENMGLTFNFEPIIEEYKSQVLARIEAAKSKVKLEAEAAYDKSWAVNPSIRPNIAGVTYTPSLTKEAYVAAAVAKRYNYLSLNIEYRGEKTSIDTENVARRGEDYRFTLCDSINDYRRTHYKTLKNLAAKFVKLVDEKKEQVDYKIKMAAAKKLEQNQTLTKLKDLFGDIITTTEEHVRGAGRHEYIKVVRYRIEANGAPRAISLGRENKFHFAGLGELTAEQIKAILGTL